MTGFFAESQYKRFIPTRNVSVIARHVKIVESRFSARDWNGDGSDKDALLENEKAHQDTNPR